MSERPATLPRTRADYRFGFRGLALATALSIVALSAPPAATAAPGGQAGIVTRARGFDACNTPTLAQMRALRSPPSPYTFANFYVGGPNRARCDFRQLNARWVSEVVRMGYRLLPTWVGRQAPQGCTAVAYPSRMSRDPRVAYQQGRAEAAAAARAAIGVGLNRGTVIYDDIEKYYRSGPCQDAVRSFVHGWSQWMAEWGGHSGVYGDACNAADWALAPRPPSQVWLARWNVNDPSVWSVDRCLSDRSWSNHQRFHQFQGEHLVTYNGVTIEVDDNCADGRAVGAGLVGQAGYCVAR